MGASRKIEHYGEITIRCTNGTSCTITFPKVLDTSYNIHFIHMLYFESIIDHLRIL